MKTNVDDRIVLRKRSWIPVATLWAAFGVVALFIQRAVGCPLAGCANATIALGAGLALAFTLASLLTHSDRIAAHDRARIVSRKDEP